jgi:hypothetical protein
MESAVTVPRRSKCVRISALLAAVAALGIAAQPASAQGLFDFLFGGPRRPGPPPSAHSYADPFGPRPAEPRIEASPSVAYCVRLCDGRYFPIQRVSSANPAQVCNSFCPAARTRIFSGSEIAHAAAGDGSRYKDLPNAFVYRDRTVADCTCNGKDPYGLASADAKGDPTLRPGDIVATDHGFVAYNGGRRNAEFTPLDTRNLSAELRRLAATRIEPREASPRPEPALTGSTGDKSVQLKR